MEKYISPFTDFGFKKLFGEEANQDILIDFLNQLLLDIQAIQPPFSEKIYQKAFEVAEIARYSPQEYSAYLDSIKVYRDFKNSVDTAFKEGEIEEKKEEKLTIALAMKQEGMPVDLIAKLTGLSIEEINNL
jgi:predicted transposase/invertase (TIGR01784 family)